MAPAPKQIATPHPDFLEAALWHAARYGLGAQLIHPVRQTLVPPSKVVAALLEFTAPTLDAAGDRRAVTAMVQGLLAVGTGAGQQRGSYADGGRASLAKLIVQRTPS
ncbi:hypothetical protein ART_0321 [Arthrobacter sp. PAMC 25486]|uniref:hypothetical protein n=1 Tax=Arthrobacter sp. PAMC 25486 TaxID=1494608 RepID=UPI0005361796|nr:hypothetical protein [Arthrobacter sp. PAMC 25486]AIX99919.1 hypothetical protein ART_0321 [Arthrobacter sp. PAMC 25486]